MLPDPIEVEILAEIEKLPPHEQLARAEYHLRLSRALFAGYSATSRDADEAIDLIETRRRVRRAADEIYRAVEAELRTGVPRDLAFGRVAAARAGRPREAYDAWSIGVVWRNERHRRRRHRRLIRNARIVAAIELGGRGVRDVAWRFRLRPSSVRRIVNDALVGAAGDARAAIERLKQEAAGARGPRPGRPPAPLPRSPLAGVDPREGDGIIVSEMERWRRLSADAAGLGRRCRSRARIRAEAMLCLRRAISLVSRGPSGIAAKVQAATELQRVRLVRGLARAAIRSARADAERLAAKGGEIAAVPDRSLLLEFDRFRTLWRDACGLGRRHHGRPALKREARLALRRVIEAPAATIAGVAVKLAAADEISALRQLRGHAPAAVSQALADARRLAGDRAPLESLAAAIAVPLAGAGADRALIALLDRAWRLEWCWRASTGLIRPRVLVPLICLIASSTPSTI